MLFPLLFWGFIYYGYDFNGLYGQDGHAYFQYAESLVQYWKGESKVLGTLMWPVNYPLLGAALSFLGIPVVLALQFISAISAVGVLLFTYLLLQSFFPLRTKRMINFTFLMVGLSPIFLRTSVMVMSEMMTLFFVTGFLYFSTKALKNTSSRQLAWAAVFAGIAIGTRYAAAVLVLPLALWLAIVFSRAKKVGALGASVLLGLVGLLPTALLKGSESMAFVEHDWWLLGWNPIHIFQRSFETADGRMSFLLPNGLYVFQLFVHPIFFLLGLPLIYFFKYPNAVKPALFPLLVTLGFYLLFLMGLPFQNKRFLFMVIPIAALLLFVPYQYFMRIIALRLNVQMAFSILFVFLQLGLFSYSFLSFLNRNRLERHIAEVVERYPQKRVYGFDMDISLHSYTKSKSIFNLWEKEYNSFRHNSLVVFNEDKFREQWEGKNPMLNWRKMQKEYSLVELKDFSNGWKLYELQ